MKNVTNDDLIDLSRKLFEERHVVLEEKGRAYSSTVDRLSNFDDAAKYLHLRPEEVWAVYAHKHFSSIVSYCHDPEAPISEGIGSRIMDLQNYLDLLAAMVKRKEDV